MNSARKKAVLLDCLRQFRVPASLFLISMALIFAVFMLYGLALEPFGYAFAVTFFFFALFLGIHLIREQRKAGQRYQSMAGILSAWKDLPAPESLAEADYARMITCLGSEMEKLSSACTAEQKETQDFYTAWVHQIKTPIAVMKLALGGTEALDRRALQEELFRIEQYTDMVLAYQRLGGSSNDLVIEEYALDALIREAIRKFASQFIYKKLRLDYQGTDLRVVTDKKWFLCILEQLLSNALKYTSAGVIAITVENGVLSVADTGVGIAPEDLPRVFEKGYTGLNGRLNEKSSGLGLYLCGEAAALLNIPIRAESSPGQGSRFSLSIQDKIIPGGGNKA